MFPLLAIYTFLVPLPLPFTVHASIELSPFEDTSQYALLYICAEYTFILVNSPPPEFPDGLLPIDITVLPVAGLSVPACTFDATSWPSTNNLIVVPSYEPSKCTFCPFFSAVVAFALSYDPPIFICIYGL